MLVRTLLSGGVAVALVVAAYAAEPQKFSTRESATRFCEVGNVVWFNPHSRFYFESDSRFYGKTSKNAGGGFTCRAFAEKWGFRAFKEK